MVRPSGGRGRAPERDEAPTDQPDVPPSRYQPQTHDFTLQAIIEVQRSVGDLCAKVDRLVTDVGKHGEKISDLRETLSFLRGVVWVFGILGLLVVPVATWLLNRNFPASPPAPVAVASPSTIAPPAGGAAQRKD